VKIAEVYTSALLAETVLPEKMCREENIMTPKLTVRSAKSNLKKSDRNVKIIVKREYSGEKDFKKTFEDVIRKAIERGIT
jgi:hypothetical protein